VKEEQPAMMPKRKPRYLKTNLPDLKLLVADLDPDPQIKIRNFRSGFSFGLDPDPFLN